MPDDRLENNRRRFVQGLSAMGFGATLLPGALTAVAQQSDQVSPDMVAAAARIAGLTFSDDETATIATRLNGERSLLDSYQRIRSSQIPNDLPPALVFNPLPAGFEPPSERRPMRRSKPVLPRPATDQDLAFLPVTHLAALIESRSVTATELAELYLARLKQYDPQLLCVVNLTEELALRQARQADQEIAQGRYRGPLHGIPWGAKDLLSVRGYPTTWGASPFRDRTIDVDAAVYERLTAAGAVLVAKLTMGALAQGDRWFRGMTRNPWDLQQGSSGSSAGPGSATAAGLVGFSIGTETRGSIISPSRRCGVSGLRPTFGRVSRYGAMALSWSMDKIGPMCRSAEDCALVLDALNGRDQRDPSTFDAAFNWDAQADLSSIRLGYLPDLSERDLPALHIFRSLGVKLTEIKPFEHDAAELNFILATESAAAFDRLVRDDADQSMRPEPERSNWPDVFRLHRFVPAVEYIQANRLRTRLIEQFARVFDGLDAYIGSNLGVTNLTGNPEITFPNGFDEGRPTALSLTGQLFGEQHLVRLAQAFQSRTAFHQQRPPL